MTRVFVDDALCEQLDHVTVPVELCDQAGRMLGHFVPVGVSRQSQIAQDGCPYSEQELTRMQQEAGGRTLAEIWQRLGRI
jgi:hypothetical protein